jgi:hypothetical protein
MPYSESKRGVPPAMHSVPELLLGVHGSGTVLIDVGNDGAVDGV